MLHFLAALRNADKARVARGTVQFDMGVVFVDEGTAWGLPPTESAATVDAVRDTLAGGHAAGVDDTCCILVSSACRNARI